MMIDTALLSFVAIGAAAVFIWVKTGPGILFAICGAVVVFLGYPLFGAVAMGVGIAVALLTKRRPEWSGPTEDSVEDKVMNTSSFVIIAALLILLVWAMYNSP